MHARKTMAKGFTLVEILIVVVILGILAAIVIPQFTSASQDAKKSSALSQLQTIRSQIELYKNQHNDSAPDLVTDWTQFTEFTDIDGNTNATKTTVFKYGPYMQKPPVNPFTDSSTVVASSPAATDGWVFDGTTFQIVMDATTASDLDLDAADFVAHP